MKKILDRLFDGEKLSKVEARENPDKKSGWEQWIITRLQLSFLSSECDNRTWEFFRIQGCHDGFGLQSGFNGCSKHRHRRNGW
ncbi:MAG: hypothetical protein R2784_13990 [Saprospiraceae bacterium]